MYDDDDDDDVYYYIRWRVKLEGETDALIHWEVKVGGRSMKDVRGAVLAGSTPPFLGRERAAVDVDVGPERRSPRYHETYLALESVEESSAAVSKPRCVWLRMPVVKNLEEARRLPVRVEEQQAQ